MPNDITNQITFGTDSAALAAFQKMLTEVRADNAPLGSIDFNKLIPMPESLNIESGSRTDRGLQLYREFVEGNKSLAVQKESDPETWALGEQAFHNIEKYGCPTWYEWCTQNWGTKWNAYGCLPLGPESNTMQFLTAWTDVLNILQKLSQKYPDQRITYRWADEDMGHNVGEWIFMKGKIVEQYIPAEGSREAFEMGAEIRGVSLADCGLHLSKNGSTYEYMEEAVELPGKQEKKDSKTRGDSR